MVNFTKNPLSYLTLVITSQLLNKYNKLQILCLYYNKEIYS